MFQMMGVFAEFERAMIRERVKAGLERARAQGKTLGRPTISTATDAAIRKALKKGDVGIRKIAPRSRLAPAPCSGSRRRCRRDSYVWWITAAALANGGIGKLFFRRF
jgi:DNA invertase Pin-like site-specific DNA recombinase